MYTLFSGKQTIFFYKKNKGKTPQITNRKEGINM